MNHHISVQNTALMKAVMGRYPIYNNVLYLKSHCADINLSCEIGSTALIRAAEEDDKCVKLLIQAGADVNHQNVDGHTTLIRAAAEGQEKCVELLIQAGANVNHQDKCGQTAAMLVASSEDNEKCLKLLIQAGANVNLTNNEGSTGLMAIMLACEFRRLSGFVAVFLAAGGDVNRSNKKGETAVVLCQQNYRISDKEQVLKMLCAAGEKGDGLENDFGEVDIRLTNCCRENNQEISAGDKSSKSLLQDPKTGSPETAAEVSPVQYFTGHQFKMTQTHVGFIPVRYLN